MQGLHAGGDDDVAGLEALRRRSRGPFRSAGSRPAAARPPTSRDRRSTPPGAPPDAVSADAGMATTTFDARSTAAVDGRAEAHGLRRVLEADAHAEGARHRIGLRRHLAHPARWRSPTGRRPARRGSPSSAARLQDGRRHLEHGVAAVVAGEAHDHLAGLHDLARLGAARRHDAGRVGPSSVKPSRSRAVSARASASSSRAWAVSIACFAWS